MSYEHLIERIIFYCFALKLNIYRLDSGGECESFNSMENAYLEFRDCGATSSNSRWLNGTAWHRYQCVATLNEYALCNAVGWRRFGEKKKIPAFAAWLIWIISIQKLSKKNRKSMLRTRGVISQKATARCNSNQINSIWYISVSPDRIEWVRSCISYKLRR